MKVFFVSASASGEESSKQREVRLRMQSLSQTPSLAQSLVLEGLLSGEVETEQEGNWGSKSGV